MASGPHGAGRKTTPTSKPHQKLRILEKLHHSTLFETFLNKKYPGQTRFSLEGADALIPTLVLSSNLAGENGCREVIMECRIAGASMCRQMCCTNPFEDIFCEFEGTYDPDIVGAGDVKYHKGYIADINSRRETDPGGAD